MCIRWESNKDNFLLTLVEPKIRYAIISEIPSHSAISAAKALEKIKEFFGSKFSEKLVTDITYLFYGDGKKKSYLSAIKDLFNNEIIAYKISKHLDLSFVLETVNTAVKRNNNSITGLILHSAQGFHYTSMDLCQYLGHESSNFI